MTAPAWSYPFGLVFVTFGTCVMCVLALRFRGRFTQPLMMIVGIYTAQALIEDIMLSYIPSMHILYPYIYGLACALMGMYAGMQREFGRFLFAWLAITGVLIYKLT